MFSGQVRSKFRLAQDVSRVLLLAAICFASLLIPLQQAQAQNGAVLRKVADMIVIGEGPHKGDLFTSDTETPTLFFSDAKADSDGRIPFSSFRPFVSSEGLVKPRGLAYHAGKLYVCDEAREAVFTVDLQTRAVKLLRQGAPIKEPTIVAVSDKGRTAVAGKRSESVVLLEPDGRVRVVEHKFRKPSRLLFKGSDLLILDENGGIFRVEEENLKPVRIPLPKEFVEELDEGEDFSLYRNIYYGVGEGHFITFVLNESGVYRQFDTPLTIPYPKPRLHTPTRIVVTGEDLFLVDSKGDVIWKIARPVPVDVRFDGSAERTSAAQAELLGYLHDRKLLPTQTVIPIKRFHTLEQLLVEKQVLLTRLPASGATKARARLGEVICALNPKFCERLNNTPEKSMGRPVNPAQILTLPDLPLKENVVTGRVALGDKTVGEYLSANFPTEAERQKYATFARIIRLNTQKSKQQQGNIDVEQWKGDTVLPIRRWQLTTLALAEDLNAESSPLQQLQENYKDMHILSEEEVEPSPQDASVTLASFGSQQPNNKAEEVEQNRQALKKEIHFPPRTPDVTKFIIGVGEDPSHLDQTHPDFVTDEGQSIWFEATLDATDVVRHALDPNRPSLPRKIGEPFSENDHGTHVGGLLAARDHGLVPGLLPTLKGLFLIDRNSPANLVELIQAAKDAGPVHIFNFSFSMPDIKLYAPLKEKLRGDWKECLFVVAAGDARGTSPAEQNLEIVADAPIAWIENVPNMIGVGASVSVSSNDETIMMPLNDGNPGSKYGKRYVQLVAPGRAIYSQAKDNSYKAATGTSQSVPQVTAAAVMLFAEDVNDPVRIKARLMYTSDWYSSFQDKVYGGLLNVQRAVWEPTRDLLRTVDAKDTVKAITVENNPLITVEGQVDDPSGEGLAPSRPIKIKFRNIYRIMRQPGANNLARVFYLDDVTRRLRVINNATLSSAGKVKCVRQEEWDDANALFKPPAACGDLDIADFFDYVIDIRFVPVTMKF